MSHNEHDHKQHKPSWGWAFVAMILCIIGALLIQWALAGKVNANPNPPGLILGSAPVSATAHVASHDRCTTPAPASAAGFAALWAKLPVDQWAAADLSISVRLADGRSVWLYGDTFSTGRFVHSTAIVQDGSCLHVSNGGTQLLPNDDATHIYWIDSATASGSRLTIQARAIKINPVAGVFGFADTGVMRTAYATVGPAGNIGFDRWGARHASSPVGWDNIVACPGQKAANLSLVGHICYLKKSHSEFKLTDGHTLTTISQNWADSKVHATGEYAPLWTG